MNTKQFLDKLTDNWPAKIICFVLAILIYFFHQMSVLGKKTFTVPLTIESSGLVSSSSQDGYRYIKVTVRGKKDQLATVSESDFKAYLDITHQTEEGHFEFPVQVEPAERVLLMEPLEIKASPERIALDIEKTVFKFVTVKPSFSGEVAYGYEQVGATVEPGSIRVSGPRSLVESLDAVYTDAVDVKDLSGDEARTVRLISPSRLLTLNTSATVTVDVKVRPVGMTKTIENIEISFENISDFLEITSSSSSVLDVVLEGDLLVLENVSAELISVYADCSGIIEEGDYDIPVVVVVPSKTKLASQSIAVVSVTVGQKTVEAVEEEKLPQIEEPITE